MRSFQAPRTTGTIDSQICEHGHVDEPPTRHSGMPDFSDVDGHRLAQNAADALAAITGVPRHDVAVVLGTGLAGAADALGPALSRHPLDTLPGMPSSFVSHQTSEFRSLEVEGRRVLVFLGRLHLYEGYSPAQVVHAVRTAAAAGCSTVILTNASGSLSTDLGTGSLALIADHINLTGRSPLTAHPGEPGLHTPFVDLVDAWSPRLRQVARAVDPGSDRMRVRPARRTALRDTRRDPHAPDPGGGPRRHVERAGGDRGPAGGGGGARVVTGHQPGRRFGG